MALADDAARLAARAAGWASRQLGRAINPFASTGRKPAPGAQQPDRGGGRSIVPALGSGPRTDEYTDLIIGQQDAWSIGDVRTALSNHEIGQFVSSALLCDFMLRDDRITSALNIRILGLTGLPRTVSAARENDSRCEAAAVALREDWPLIFPESIQSEIKRWTVLQGFCLCEIVWDTYRDRWLPRLKFWHPQYLYYRLDLKKYVALTQEGPIVIDPGDGKWFLHAPNGLHRGWIYGAVRPLAIPFMLRQFAYRDWGRYNEVHGMPIKGARVPMSASDVDKRAFWQQVAAIGSTGALMLPQGSDGQSFALELIEAENHQSWESFERLLMRGDAAVNLVLLGQNISGGDQKGGAFSGDAKVADGVRDDIKQADAKAFDNDAELQVIRPWTVYNFGDETLTPHSRADSKPPEDKNKSATTMKTAAEAGQILQTMGFEIDQKRFADTFMLPVKIGQQLVPLQPTTPAPEESDDGDKSARANSVRLSRISDPRDRVLATQLFLDRVSDKSIARAKRAMRSQLAVVKEVIEQARDYDELRTLMLHCFKDMDPRPLESLIHGAEKIALGTGVFGVHQERKP